MPGNTLPSLRNLILALERRVNEQVQGSTSGTNTGDVTLAGTPNYLTIAGQVITRGLINLASHVTGRLPYANLTASTAASRLLGRGDSGSGDWQEIALGTGLSMSGSTLSGSGGLSDGDKGDITVSGSGGTWTIDPDVVTYAKMQNVSATARVLGRKTASAGDPEECTLSEVLDFIGSAAQGDILYRGASAWARLPAGSSGQVLTTAGTGANPSWGTVAGGSGGGLVLLEQHTAANSASLDFPSVISSAYDTYRIEFVDVFPVTDSVDLNLHVTTNNGSSYDTTLGNYGWSRWAWVSTATGSGGTNNDTRISTLASLSNDSTIGGGDGWMQLYAPGGSRYKKFVGQFGNPSTTNSLDILGYITAATYKSATAITGFRFAMTSGNISDGTIRVYGVAK